MFKYEIELSEEQLSDFKNLKKIVVNENIELNEDLKNILSKYFETQKKDVVKKYKKRKDGIGNYLKDDKLFDYMKILNFYIYTKINKERERALKFLYNKKEAEKANFIDENEYKILGKKMPKQTDKQISDWAEKAYPKLELEKWEEEFNINLLRASIL